MVTSQGLAAREQVTKYFRMRLKEHLSVMVRVNQKKVNIDLASLFLYDCYVFFKKCNFLAR